jgi:kynurenine formamidase
LESICRPKRPALEAIDVLVRRMIAAVGSETGMIDDSKRFEALKLNLIADKNQASQLYMMLHPDPSLRACAR